MKRFISFLVCLVFSFSVFAGTVMRAEAAAPSLLPVGVAAAGLYMTATGVPLSVISGGSGAASAAITSAAGSYAAASGVASSGEAFLASVASGVTVSPAGVIILSAVAASALAGFCYWIYSNYLSDTDTYPIINNFSLPSSIGDFYLSDARWSNGSLFSNTDIISLGSSFSNPITIGSLSLWVEDNYLYYTTFYGVTRPAFYLRDVTAPVPIYLFYNFSANSTTGTEFKLLYFKNNGDIGNQSALRYNEVMGDSSLSKQSVDVSNHDYDQIVVPDNSVLNFDIGLSPGVSLDEASALVPEFIADGSLSVVTSVDSITDPDLPSEPDLPSDPTLPFLPSISTPWHYVVDLFDDISDFLGVWITTFTSVLPDPLVNCFYASVVLLVTFGIIMRFL